MRTTLTCLVIALAIARPATAAPQPSPVTDPGCQIGVYRLSDGQLIDIAPSSGGLRWRLFDGRTGALQGEGRRYVSTLGSTGRPDGHAVSFGACGSGTLTFDALAGARVSLETSETRFASASERLAGRLVLPPGDAPVPVVVLVHGSEASSALDYAAWQRMLPAAGIGAFVYDKRGTGRSSGRYTQDFHVLASDAAAAAREAQRLAGARMQALVYAGGSQGGWVAPLAHQLEPADRMIISYGLTVSPLEENRSEVLQDVAAAGYTGKDLAAAGEVVDATSELMVSGFRTGFSDYARVRRRYRASPWYPRIEGEFSGQILRHAPLTLRLIAPIARRKADRGTPWRYDPLPALRRADVPTLWVLAGADTSAPPEQTRRDLLRLRSEGEPITVLEFPGAEHGITEFETRADGTRATIRVADGYLQAVIDFARSGKLDAEHYGRGLHLSAEGADR